MEKWFKILLWVRILKRGGGGSVCPVGLQMRQRGGTNQKATMVTMVRRPPRELLRRKQHATASQINRRCRIAVVVRSSSSASQQRDRPLEAFASGFDARPFQSEGGVRLETLRRDAATTSSSSPNPPPTLVFLHGSYHASWCFAENFFGYFAERGYDCAAMSFVGQGLSSLPPPDKEPARVAGTLESHARDVRDFLRNGLPSGPKIVVAHSFGGLVLQKAISLSPPMEDVRGIALLCSVPPTGNSAMVGRFLRRTPIAAIKLSYAFIARTFERDLASCVEFFLSPALTEGDARRYQELIAVSCRLPLLDLRALPESLPVDIPKNPPPCLVLGSRADKVVDVDAIDETAAAFGAAAQKRVLSRIGHDCMLDAGWEEVAQELHGFAQGVLR